MEERIPLGKKVIPDLWTLREMVDYPAQKAPDLTALYKGIDNDIPMSFGEVAHLIQAIGTYLMHCSLPTAQIAVLGENSTEWILAFFGITNSGHVIVPLDPELPAGELAELSAHCECSAIFCSGKYRDTGRQISDACGECRVFSIEDVYDYAREGESLIAAGDHAYEDVVIEPDTLAAIVFTSGTTGRKKGVMLTHGNLTSDAVATCRTVQGYSAHLLLPLHHTFAWSTTMFSVMLFLIDLHISSSLRHIARDLQKYRPHNIAAVPMIVEMLYKNMCARARKGDKFPDPTGGNLELILCGGASLDPDIQRAMYDAGIEITTGYGITECSPVVAVLRNHDIRFGSVGKPIPCNKVKIHDPDEHGIGEIYVSGSNVMKGYYKDPEATAEAFDGEWFKTGDCGRFDEDGYLYITGRKKNLIILSNGENISPEELERKLRRIEYVREVAVYEEDHKITAEFYLNETACPDARDKLSEDVKAFNRSVSKSKNIQHIKVRHQPFEKTTTMKIKRYKIEKGNEIDG